MHSRGRNTAKTVNATALLGFKTKDENDEDRKKNIKKEKIVL